MRGRKKRKKDKNGRFLQEAETNVLDPIIPRDNECGKILMRKLAATGNPAFECLFSRGAFISSFDPRAVALLLEDEKVLDQNKKRTRARNAGARELEEDDDDDDDDDEEEEKQEEEEEEEDGIVMPINDSSVDIVEMPNGTYSAFSSFWKRLKKLAPVSAEVDSL